MKKMIKGHGVWQLVQVCDVMHKLGVRRMYKKNGDNVYFGHFKKEVALDWRNELELCERYFEKGKRKRS